MSRARALTVLLVLVSLLAGCTEGPAATAEGGEGGATGAPEPRFMEETRTETHDLTGRVTGAAASDHQWSPSELGRNRFRIDVPADATGLELVLSWDDRRIDLDLIARAPDGRAFTNTAGEPGDGDEPATLTLADGVLPGEWFLEVRGKNAVDQPFRLDATVTYTVRVPVDGDTPVPDATGVRRGDIRVEAVGDRYRAERTVTYRTDLSDTEAVRWVADTRNGGIAVRGDDDGSQSVLEATLYAEADTEEAARARLEAVDVDYEAVLAEGRADVAAHAILKDGGDWSGRGATFDVEVPAGREIDLEARATNGGIRVTDLDGPSVHAKTTNAGVDLTDLRVGGLTVDTMNGALSLKDVDAVTATLSTTNAGVSGNLVANDLNAKTTNGGVNLDLEARASGTWRVVSTNGGITVTLPEAEELGYRLVAETSTYMRATVTMDDVEFLENEDHRKRVLTRNYEGRDVRTEASFRTTNANVNVRGV